MSASSEPSPVTPTGRKRTGMGSFIFAVGFLLLFKLLLLTGYWAWTLFQIPLIPEPMDVDQFVAELKVADAENAANDYLQAASLLKDFDREKLGDLNRLEVTRWEEFSDEIQKLVRSNIAALNVWLGGAEKQRACTFDPLQPGSAASFDIPVEIRKLAWPITLKAMQLQDERGLDESWRFLSGGLRTVVHLDEGGQVNSRLVGSAFLATLSPAIQRWGEDPDLTIEQLRKAQGDFDRIAATIPPISHTIKAGFLTYRDLAAYWRNMTPGAKPDFFQDLFISRMGDSANRLQRHVVRNILSQCDLPRFERTWQKGSELFVDLKPSGPELPSDQIAKLGEKNVIYSLIAPTYFPLVETSDRERMRISALKLSFALQLHFRERDAFPDHLEQLVPQYLPELPPNPYADDGRTWSYRKEADHVVLWNHGEYLPVDPEEGFHWSPSERGSRNATGNAADSRHFWTVYPPGTRPPLYRPLPEAAEAKP